MSGALSPKKQQESLNQSEFTHTHTSTHADIHTRTRSRTHTHTHTHTQALTRTHTHTQSNRLLEWKAFSATVLLTGSYSISLRCFFWGGISRGNLFDSFGKK